MRLELTDKRFFSHDCDLFFFFLVITSPSPSFNESWAKKQLIISILKPNFERAQFPKWKKIPFFKTRTTTAGSFALLKLITN